MFGSDSQQKHCYASCHVTWPMLCNSHKYLNTCVHPSLITVLSATIEVNVTQLFVIIVIYNVSCCTVCKCKIQPCSISMYLHCAGAAQLITRLSVVGKIRVNIAMETDQGNWMEISKLEIQPSCWVSQHSNQGKVKSNQN